MITDLIGLGGDVAFRQVQDTRYPIVHLADRAKEFKYHRVIAINEQQSSTWSFIQILHGLNFPFSIVDDELKLQVSFKCSRSPGL